MLISHRFAGALATVTLALGAGTAFADHGDGHDGDGNDHHQGGTALKSDLFGSRLDGPSPFGVKPGGAPVGDRLRPRERQARRPRDGPNQGLVIPTAPQNGTNPL